MKPLPYGTEPADLKLIAILFSKKIKIVLGLTLLGGLIAFAVTYFSEVVLAPEPEYQAVSEFSFEFAEEVAGVTSVYWNEQTWITFLHTQDFLNTVQENMAMEIDQDELSDAIELIGMTDARILSLKVISSDPELVLDISDGLIAAMEIFTMDRPEFNEMKILTRPESAVLVVYETYLGPAFLIGAFVAFLFASMLLLFFILWDDSIYLPAGIQERYGIPVLGILPSSKRIKDETILENERSLLKFNLDYIKNNQGTKSITIMGTEMILDETVISELEKIWNKENLQVIATPLLFCNETEIREALKDLYSDVILCVSCGNKNGRKLQRLLEELQVLNLNVKGMILTKADPSILKFYYGKSSKRSR